MIVVIEFITYIFILPILFGIYAFLRLIEILIPKKVGHWEMVLNYLDECNIEYRKDKELDNLNK